MSEEPDECDEEEEPPLPKKAAPFVCFTVRFRGQLHTLPADELDALSTVLDLKDLLADVTGVEPSNQKIMGLCKSPLFKIADDMTLGALDLKLTGAALVKSCSLMMTGTPSCELAAKKEQELAAGAGGESLQLISCPVVRCPIRLRCILLGPSARLCHRRQLDCH